MSMVEEPADERWNQEKVNTYKSKITNATKNRPMFTPDKNI